MGLFVVAFGCLSSACAYVTMVCGDRWLARWVRVIEQAAEADEEVDTLFYASVYAALIALFVLMMLLTTKVFDFGAARAGDRLHLDCLTRILHAPLSWFEETPTGRIISRFTSDLASVDLKLSEYTDLFVQFTCTILALAINIVVIVPLMAPILPIAFCLFYLQYLACDRSNREIKRLANNAMSPILTNASEVVRSRTLLRVTQQTPFLLRRHHEYADGFRRLTYFSSSLFTWGIFSGSIISCVVATCTAACILGDTGRYDATLAALALTYSYILPFFLGTYSFIIAVVRTCLTSLERVLDYRGAGVAQELPWTLPSDSRRESWPTAGAVTFDDVTLVYRPGLPAALTSVSFHVAAGERIGIIGRTGAGKSSVLVVLLRLREVTAGRVLIDEEDVAKVGLQTLRRRLTVVPQNPLLMQGSVRLNLDPFSAEGDCRLAEVLEKVGLSAQLLDVDVGLSGRLLSAGEGQLISIARTLLRRTRIVVMDEPTSNVDVLADDAVQHAIREAYKGMTVLTIAHRLKTVMDSTRLLILEAGKVKEYGSPISLSSDPSSYLSALLRALPSEAAQALLEKAHSDTNSGHNGGQQVEEVK